MKKNLQIVPFPLAVALALAPALIIPTQVNAASPNWTAGPGSGNWATASNWSTGTVPAANDAVSIAPTDGLTHVITYNYTGPAITLTSLTLNFLSTPSTFRDETTLNMSANNLTSNQEIIGNAGASGNGDADFQQSGGINTTSSLYLGLNPTTVGQYGLSGTGSLIASSEIIGYGGNGAFTQVSGTHVINGGGNSLFIGYNAGSYGEYNLQGGSLAVTGFEILGYLGSGIMTQLGGTHTIAPGYYFSLGSGGGVGTYTLGGTGVLTSSSAEYVGSNGSGTFTQTAGTNTITAGNFLVIANLPGSTGLYYLSGTGIANILGNAYVGGSDTTAGGAGLLDLQAGAMTITGTLKIWNTPNTAVNLTGGTLSIGALDVNNNPSHFTWTAGTLNIGSLLIGATGPLGASLNIIPAKTLNSSGTITNNGTLTLSGGTLGGVGITINNNTFTGFGTLAGSGGFTNNGLFTYAGGDLVVTNTGLFTNNATIQLVPGNQLQLLGGNLANSGFLALNTATLTGTATLVNNAAGTISGSGAIQTPFTNAGLVVLNTGNLQLPSFTNNGTVELAGLSANIGPTGTITNAATIEGNGKIAMAIVNNATIEATGGSTLILAAPLTNTGTIAASTGNKILMQGTGNFPTNAGIISLAGGTFDTNNQPLNNTGQITGFGILRTGGLFNNGSLTFTGGTTTINGPVTNAAGKTIVAKNDPAIFTGNITNNGTIKTTNTTVTFTGNYSGNAFISDPSTNIFQGTVTITSGGLMTGSTGDQFIIDGTAFTNNGTFTNGGLLQTAASVTNTASFSQSGPQSWSQGATFTNSSGTATFASNAKLFGLTITAGTVDITTSKFIVEATTNKSATLQSNIATHSLISSTLPSNFGLALLDNAITHFTTFGGNPVDSNSLLLSPELLGDANADGTVNVSDLSTVLTNFGTTTPAWTSGNFDNAPTIDLTDLSDVLNNFGLTNPSNSVLSTQSSTLSIPTPEPATLALVALTIPLLSRRRQQSTHAGSF